MSEHDDLIAAHKGIANLNDKREKAERRVRDLALDRDRWKARALFAEAQLHSLRVSAT